MRERLGSCAPFTLASKQLCKALQHSTKQKVGASQHTPRNKDATEEARSIGLCGNGSVGAFVVGLPTVGRSSVANAKGPPTREPEAKAGGPYKAKTDSSYQTDADIHRGQSGRHTKCISY